MELKIVGTALIVKSSLTAADVEAANVYAPDALTVLDEDGNDVFTVTRGNAASISKHGAVFNGVTAGHLQATLIIPDQEDAAAKKQYVKENYGNALVNLAEAESIIAGAIDEVLSSINGTFENMEVE